MQGELNDLRSDKNNIKKIVTESIGNNRLIYIANTYKAECEVASILVHMSMQPSLLKFNDSEINEALIQSEKDGLKLYPPRLKTSYKVASGTSIKN